MHLEPLESTTALKQGNHLLIDDGTRIIFTIIIDIKVSDDVVVIVGYGKNFFFSLTEYLKGVSWAKEICVVHKGSQTILK